MTPDLSTSPIPTIGNDPGLMADRLWFQQHDRRRIRIRSPLPDELDAFFRTLGDHAIERRRILAYRYTHVAELVGHIFRIPLIAFADETIEDEEKPLLKLLDEMMREQE